MRPVGLRLALISITLLSLGFFLARPWWFPAGAAERAATLDRAFHATFFLIGLLFLAGQLVLFWVIGSRGRAASDHNRKELARDPRWHGNWKLELAWTLAIASIFFWFNASGVRLWSEMIHPMQHGDVVEVEITGAQFQWYFRYPGADGKFGHVDMQRYARAAEGNPLGIDPDDPSGKDDIVASTLVLPAGRDVDLTLRAQDVIHSVFIPAMRFKQDAVPGMEIHAHLQPIQAGTYELVCSQLCGLGHYRMRATARVVSEQEFRGWLQSQSTR